MTKMTDIKYNAQLMNRYYDERGKSEVSIEPFFRLKKVQWSDAKLNQQVIDKNTAKLESVFYENEAAFSYLNGYVYVKATIPFFLLRDGEEKKLETIGIMDGNDGLVGVVAFAEHIQVMTGREIDLLIKISARES